MKDIVLASSNKGKIAELQILLSPLGWHIKPQSDFAISDAQETGSTFAENALIKARHAARLSNLPAIADDSGLCVDALHGAPGIYSARFAGSGATDEKNNAKLLADLANVPEEKRQAHFHCTLVFVNNAGDPAPIVCEKQWHGFILRQARGDNGFGYDPLFWVPTHQCSSAQLPVDEKNKQSHRGQALQELLVRLQALS